MANILYNEAGAPLLISGRNFVAGTQGTPEKAVKSSSKQDDVEDKVSVGSVEVVSWGAGNDYPQQALQAIGEVAVLNSGLRFIRNFTIGQGIYAVKVEGYDDKGNEILKPYDDEKVNRFLQGRMVRRYLERSVRDYLKFGRSFPELIPNVNGDKMVGLGCVNAKHCRVSVARGGVIEKCIVSGKWPDTPSRSESSILPVLDEYDPVAHLNRLRYGNQIKGKSFIFPMVDTWSNEDYYGLPIWHSAFKAGWIKIAKMVPKFLEKAYQNQISWKWHIQIPYSFWDKQFPKDAYENVSERKSAIDSYMDDIETSLCGAENAEKAIFTFFEINPQNGKAEEQWIITPLDNKYKEGDKLVTSAAANSEILFALGINPNVMGAGMPGGAYAGNQGGSNIREAFLVNVANAWLDRQNLLDPIEAFLMFNGVDCELRFRNTILTTLDSGSGTQKVIS